ncbi:hypothetical protein D3C85_829680 [compost metagenome]
MVARHPVRDRDGRAHPQVAVARQPVGLGDQIPQPAVAIRLLRNGLQRIARLDAVRARAGRRIAPINRTERRREVVGARGGPRCPHQFAVDHQGPHGRAILHAHQDLAVGVVDQRLVLAAVLAVDHAHHVAVDVVLVRRLARIKLGAYARQRRLAIALVARMGVGIGIGVRSPIPHVHAVLGHVAGLVVAGVSIVVAAGEAPRRHMHHTHVGDTARRVVHVALLFVHQAGSIKEGLALRPVDAAHDDAVRPVVIARVQHLPVSAQRGQAVERVVTVGLGGEARGGAAIGVDNLVPIQVAQAIAVRVVGQFMALRGVDLQIGVHGLDRGLPVHGVIAIPVVAVAPGVGRVRVLGLNPLAVAVGVVVDVLAQIVVRDLPQPSQRVVRHDVVLIDTSPLRGALAHLVARVVIGIIRDLSYGGVIDPSHLAGGVVAVIQVLPTRIRLGQQLAGVIVGVVVLGATDVGVRHQTTEVVIRPRRSVAIAVGFESLVAASVVGRAQFRGQAGLAYAGDVAAQVVAEIGALARAVGGTELIAQFVIGHPFNDGLVAGVNEVHRVARDGVIGDGRAGCQDQPTDIVIGVAGGVPQSVYPRHLVAQCVVFIAVDAAIGMRFAHAVAACVVLHAVDIAVGVARGDVVAGGVVVQVGRRPRSRDAIGVGTDLGSELIIRVVGVARDPVGGPRIGHRQYVAPTVIGPFDRRTTGLVATIGAHRGPSGGDTQEARHLRADGIGVIGGGAAQRVAGGSARNHIARHVGCRCL